jgi:hypothetical protein
VIILSEDLIVTVTPDIPDRDRNAKMLTSVIPVIIHVTLTPAVQIMLDHMIVPVTPVGQVTETAVKILMSALTLI